MTLARVIIAKIIITLLFWSVPLLFGSKALFIWVGIPLPDPEVFVRLLGAAYFALVVAYYHGLLDVRAGRTATATVQMGLVSNGAAAVILGVNGVRGVWVDWAPLAQIYMWASFCVASLIAIGLIVARSNQIVVSADRSANTAE